MRTEIILQHGWGMDSRCWSEWSSQLASLDRNLHCILGERGYFGQPVARPNFWNKSARKVLIVHSLGLHLVPESVITASDLVIAFGSFLEFHPHDPLERKRSRRTLKSMLDKFHQKPQAVLEQYWTDCSLPYSSWPQLSAEINESSLQTDLELLDQHVFDPELLYDKQIRVLQGELDRIVSAGVARQLGELPSARLHIFPQAGHALPFTQAKSCIDLLLTELPTTPPSPALR